jgi:hypothetical protein
MDVDTIEPGVDCVESDRTSRRWLRRTNRECRQPLADLG